MAKAKPKTPVKQDFDSLFQEFSTRVDETEVLQQDALLSQQLRDFRRMSEMNDRLWDEIESNGYSWIDEKTGRMVINPAVGTFNKNASTLLKMAQVIEEKTKAVLTANATKTWY